MLRRTAIKSLLGAVLGVLGGVYAPGTLYGEEPEEASGGSVLLGPVEAKKVYFSRYSDPDEWGSTEGIDCWVMKEPLEAVELIIDDLVYGTLRSLGPNKHSKKGFAYER